MEERLDDEYALGQALPKRGQLPQALLPLLLHQSRWRVDAFWVPDLEMEVRVTHYCAAWLPQIEVERFGCRKASFLAGVVHRKVDGREQHIDIVLGHYTAVSRKLSPNDSVEAPDALVDGC